MIGPQVFRSANGKYYPGSPWSTVGRDGHTLYWGNDFDSACHDTGFFERGMQRTRKLAKIIRDSGRRLVWVVAPNKPAAVPGPLRGVPMPGGQCSRKGVVEQRRILDTFQEKSYLPLRRKLVNYPGQTYWNEDLHWTTVGASVFVRAVVEALSPKAARTIHYLDGTATYFGGMHLMQGPNEKPEVAPAKLPDPSRTIVVPPGAVDIGGGLFTSFGTQWQTQPRTGTVRGRTLILGDSFTYLALPVLRPYFADGRYIWYNQVSNDVTIKSIQSADTVVLETVQNFMTFDVMRTPAFLRELRRALADDIKRHKAGKPSKHESGPSDGTFDPPFVAAKRS